MENGRPATVSVAFIGEFVLFAATVKLTEPLPVPTFPVRIVTHDGAPDTVHGQPAAVLTVTNPEPPAGEKTSLALASEYAQVVALTVIERPCAADVAPALSRTVTLKFEVPTKDGVPLTTPVAEFSASPGGSTPLATVHKLYGGVPPVAVSCAE